MSTYVYGITSRSHPPPRGVSGVGDPPCAVRSLTRGSLAALVSDVPVLPRPGRADRRAHARVVAHAAATGTVLPLGFGTLAPDDEAVTGRLARRAEHYAERLDALAGRVEYRLTAGPRSRGVDAALRRALEPEVEALTAGTDATGRFARVTCLVDRAETESFLGVVARARRNRPDTDVGVDGPLPPYDFVESCPPPTPAPRGAAGGPLEVAGGRGATS
ncbi:GvpL/GvpF family gas vesicle protein [Streptomyces sp. HSG2]|uniref:GvpL/GvpF family gas vesicle protein n=1 Tax=Streptomyces sp. HSG2 TaxID=2797167 RepID=UPI001907049B|nr:GvpL/GvpF family gas vesicle protein [Streptomyces sp. HSG2]